MMQDVIINRRQQSREAISAVDEAYLMLSAFQTIGVDVWDVMIQYEKSATKEKEFCGRRRLSFMWESVEHWLEDSLCSLIVKPHLPKDTSTHALVQLDDLTAEVVARVQQFAFCVTETSPGSFQAFVAVWLGATDYKQTKQGMIVATGADKGATGALRLAGSFNTKQKHRRADGSYPRVRLVMVEHSRIVTVADLRAVGLYVDVPPVSHPPAPSATQIAPHKRRRVGSARRVPSYDKALQSVQVKDDGEPDRSAADLLFAVTCFRWRPPLSPDEVAALLMQHSEKARKRKDADWYIQNTINEALQRA
jgi:hypothetical protein